MFGAVGLTLASLTLTPPIRYPDLFPVLVSVYSCAHFVLFLIVFHVIQFQSQTTGIKIKKIQ
jgi:alpha-1,3-glucosyltransferase